jgi:hypothetical protein
MSIVAVTAALVGIATVAVIYGTDVFSALVLRPAAAHATDASIADLVGWVHEYGDRRLTVPGGISILAAAFTVGFTRSDTGRAAAATSVVALLMR